MVDQPVLEGFGGFEHSNNGKVFKEYAGPCFLKTKDDTYKSYKMVLSGNELRFFRKETDKEHRLMHSLFGTYL